MSDSGKTQLGKILLKRKLVSSSELDNILHEQAGDKDHSERLASKVLEKGLTDELLLLRALSEQAGVPAVNLESLQIDLKTLNIVPREIATQHAILPIDVSEDSINLAMANPDDQRVIDEVEFVSGKRVFPHVALHAQIVTFVEESYRAKDAGETIYKGAKFDNSKENALINAGASESSANSAHIDTVLPEDNDQNLGLSIDVELPCEELIIDSDPEFTPERIPSSSKRALEKKKILVVDDEEDIRLLISRVLTEKGYEIVTAGRGLEAIKLVQKENPDMIILDAMLPEVHGFDICKKIKGSKKYGHIPVIMISAIYRGWRYAQDLKDSYGVDDFIEKPFKLGEFLEKVETHFKLHSADTPESEEDLSLQTEKVLSDSVKAYRSGDVDSAIDLLKDGLKIDPLAFKLHYNLALLLGKKALNYQAIRELENALELAPNYFPALKNLALLYQKAGFKFKSVETWERALHHCPDAETHDSIKQHLVNLL